MGIVKWWIWRHLGSDLAAWGRIDVFCVAFVIYHLWALGSCVPAACSARRNILQKKPQMVTSPARSILGVSLMSAVAAT